MVGRRGAVCRISTEIPEYYFDSENRNTVSSMVILLYYNLLNLKFIAHVCRVIPAIPHMSSCLHICRCRGVVLCNSTFLVSPKCISRKVRVRSIQGVSDSFHELGCRLSISHSLASPLHNRVLKWALDRKDLTYPYKPTHKVQRQSIPQYGLHKHPQCQYVHPSHHGLAPRSPT